MKTLPAGLQEHLDGGATTLSWCWRITRSDGVVFGFTDHDLPLSFDGTEFEPESGLVASELRAGSGLEVDAQDAQGVLSSERITETDIRDGRWDNAAVEVWRVNWSNTAERVLLRRGALGDIRRGRVAFTAEVRSLAHVLGQTVGRTYTGRCDAVLGDGRCSVNLSAPAFRGAATVADIARDRVVLTNGLTGFASGLFSLGVIEWTSGANTGRRAEIARHDLDGSVAVLTLLEPFVRAPASGDAFEAVAGCDKSVETCAARFSNVVNFRGFPHIPGQDSMVRFAKQGGGNEGGVL